jgi:hypothetical protein
VVWTELTELVFERAHPGFWASKAPEGWRTPRRFAFQLVAGRRASVGFNRAGQWPLDFVAAQGVFNRMKDITDTVEEGELTTNSPEFTDKRNSIREIGEIRGRLNLGGNQALEPPGPSKRPC